METTVKLRRRSKPGGPMGTPRPVEEQPDGVEDIVDLPIPCKVLGTLHFRIETAKLPRWEPPVVAYPELAEEP